MTVFVGIDPGKNGGICILSKHGQILGIMPMPSMARFAEIAKELSANIGHLYLEKSHAYPGQGVVSIFNYGEHFGCLQGILLANKISYTLISPRTWQKHMILPSKETDPKKKALATANRVFKKNKWDWLPSKRHKIPHDGMIDSALIAEYCRRVEAKTGKLSS